VTAFHLELRSTWFKRYHVLFPNYTSAFISFFNCLYQRDQNAHTRSRNFRVSFIKTCQIVKIKNDETKAKGGNRKCCAADNWIIKFILVYRSKKICVLNKANHSSSISSSDIQLSFIYLRLWKEYKPILLVNGGVSF